MIHVIAVCIAVWPCALCPASTITIRSSIISLCQIFFLFIFVLFDYEKLHQWCRSLVRKFAITRKHATKIQHERDLWQARTSQAATHIAIKETSAGFLDLTRQQVLNQIRSPTFFLSEGRICYHSTI